MNGSPLLRGPEFRVPGIQTREKGGVVHVVRTVVFGTLALVTDLPSRLQGNHRTINTSFVQRRNGTDRGQNTRKTRKSYRFSKDWDIHNAASYFICYSYNFCWPAQRAPGRCVSSKMMAPGCNAHRPWRRAPASHVWTLQEWLTYQAKPG